MTTLADKLREMTEARGCLPAEAATALTMLAELPPERLNAVAPEPKSLADIVADFAAAFDDLFPSQERTPEEEARIAAIRVRMPRRPLSGPAMLSAAA